jgi:CRISPR system Cascade subunit CasA
MENRYNLIDEPWIPVTDVGKVSLRQIFSNPEYRGLGGNPVQKIAVLKLLLAIAQAAKTPADEAEWQKLGAGGLSQDCLSYIETWHDRFYLYGENPFLQFPTIKVAAIQSCGTVLPEVATGNTTVLSQIQAERDLEDADKALLLITLMGFALGGKKTDNSVVLSVGYQGKCNDKGKPSSGKPGPSLGNTGLLHSYLLGHTLRETLWLNLLTEADIHGVNIFPEGLGAPPWEQMPQGEDCPTARRLRQSLQGRLTPLSRFCLLADKGLHYSEGLAHEGHLNGMFDPTVAVNFGGKSPQALWVNTEKRPWRELTSLLNFLEQGKNQGFQCLQLKSGLDRARRAASVLGYGRVDCASAAMRASNTSLGVMILWSPLSGFQEIS